MTAFLTQPERKLLEELTIFADWWTSSGTKPTHITLSQKQLNTFNRLIAKAKEHPTFDYATDIDADKMTFRGIPVDFYHQRTRPRKKKDTGELFSKV